VTHWGTWDLGNAFELGDDAFHQFQLGIGRGMVNLAGSR